MKAAKLTPGAAPAKEMISRVSGLRFSETFYPAKLRMPAHRHEQAAMSFVPAGGYVELREPAGFHP